MAQDGQDWQQPATIASGQMQAIGGGQKDKFSGTAGVAWAELVLVAVTTVMAWTIRNTGNEKLDVGLAEDAAAMTLDPGDSWSVPFNGRLRVKRGASADTTYQAVAIGV